MSALLRASVAATAFDGHTAGGSVLNERFSFRPWRAKRSRKSARPGRAALRGVSACAVTARLLRWHARMPRKAAVFCRARESRACKPHSFFPATIQYKTWRGRRPPQNNAPKRTAGAPPCALAAGLLIFRTAALQLKRKSPLLSAILESRCKTGDRAKQGA